jgi:hypothetical protein
MKKSLLTLTATLLCVGAFGQGRLSFEIDTSHLIYFTTDTTKLAPADAIAVVSGYPLAGSGLYTGDGSTITAVAGSPTFIAALYGGTSSSSLSLQSTTTIGGFALEGSVVPVNCTFASLAADVPAWFQIQVYDSRASSAAGAWNVNFYVGVSQVFQATPQSGPYSPIWQTGTPVNSTWAAGTFELVDWPGSYGAIEVYKYNEIPEPPYVWTQPKSTTNYWGQSATISVVASGDPMPTYQWQVNGTNLYDGPHVSSSVTNTAIGGEWLFQLSLNSLTLADIGSYGVILSNHWDTRVSDRATLTVVLIRPSVTSVLPQPNGTVTLNLTGTPNSTNRLWATASLKPPVVWSPVSTNVASSVGTWQVTDTAAVGWPARFYRASMP